MYVKHIETWNEVNEDVPPNTKYEDFVESLTTNKEIKGCPHFVGEHVLPVMEWNEDQVVKKREPIKKILTARRSCWIVIGTRSIAYIERSFNFNELKSSLTQE